MEHDENCVGARPCENIHHCNRFLCTRSHHVRNKNENDAIADSESGTPNLTTRRRSSRQEEIYRRCRVFYMGGVVYATPDNVPQIKRWIRLARACYKRLKRGLYDMEAAPFTITVRMLNTEVMETLLYLVCDVDSWTRTLRRSPNDTPPTPPTAL